MSDILQQPCIFCVASRCPELNAEGVGGAKKVKSKCRISPVAPGLNYFF